MLDQITPLIITYNEEPNIERTLSKVKWAKRIVVIDSGSTDGTLAILHNYPQVEVLHHNFQDFAMQWNFGLDQIASLWVLSLDADYQLSDAFVEELASLVPATNMAGYAARFIYRINGKALRASLYPARTVLFRKEKARYCMDGHTQRVAIQGAVRLLNGVIYHDDRKSLMRWFTSQQRYARDEAEFLLARRGAVNMSRADRLRLLAWPAPIAVLLHALFVKGCLLDGWPGWFYALQRLLAETLLALEIIDQRLRADGAGQSGPNIPNPSSIGGDRH